LGRIARKEWGEEKRRGLREHRERRLREPNLRGEEREDI
jgi:hypothetical protein